MGRQKLTHRVSQCDTSIWSLLGEKRSDERDSGWVGSHIVPR
jgi:hypothetical protein